MHNILVKNFQKLPSAGGSPSPSTLNLRFWWPKVAWFDQIGVFQIDYDETELKNWVMASFQ